MRLHLECHPVVLQRTGGRWREGRGHCGSGTGKLHRCAREARTVAMTMRSSGAHLHMREHIVLRLCLAADLNLLQAHRDGVRRDIAAWHNDAQTRPKDACELATALHDLICANWRAAVWSGLEGASLKRGGAVGEVSRGWGGTLTEPVSTVVQQTMM